MACTERIPLTSRETLGPTAPTNSRLGGRLGTFGLVASHELLPLALNTCICLFKSYYSYVHSSMQEIRNDNNIPYSGNFWRGKSLVDLVNETLFANILPCQIPDSLQ